MLLLIAAESLCRDYIFDPWLKNMLQLLKAHEKRFLESNEIGKYDFSAQESFEMLKQYSRLNSLELQRIFEDKIEEIVDKIGLSDKNKTNSLPQYARVKKTNAPTLTRNRIEALLCTEDGSLEVNSVSDRESSKYFFSPDVNKLKKEAESLVKFSNSFMTCIKENAHAIAKNATETICSFSSRSWLSKFNNYLRFIGNDNKSLDERNKVINIGRKINAELDSYILAFCAVRDLDAWSACIDPSYKEVASCDYLRIKNAWAFCPELLNENINLEYLKSDLYVEDPCLWQAYLFYNEIASLSTDIESELTLPFCAY